MSGRRAKQLRKKALALHPEGSTIEMQVTKTVDGHPVAGRIVYGGFRRAYKNFKKEI